MSLTQSSGIKYKRENFKALKDEMQNINKFINAGGGSSAVLLNENSQYVYRVQNRDAYYSRPSPERNYIFNQILKHYELNTNQTAQGFNGRYFNELSELLSLKYIHTNDYTKKRIELFNSRINRYHKSYINYLKKKGKDLNLQSTINKKINTKNKFLNYKYIDKIKLRNRNIFSKTRSKTNLSLINRNAQKQGLFSDYKRISNLSYFNQFSQNVTSKNDNSISSVKDDSFNSMRNIANQKHLYNSALYMNKFRIRNSDLDFGKNISSLSPTNKDDNKNNLNNINNNISYNNNVIDNNEKDEEMKIMEEKSKNEFLNTFNRKNYMDFLKNKYRFIEGKHNEEKEYKETVKIMKRHNMFRLRPKNDFLKKQTKDMDKFIFFKKIENDNNKLLNTSSEIKIKKREKKNKIFVLSPKTNQKIFNNSVNQNFNIFLKDSKSILEQYK